MADPIPATPAGGATGQPNPVAVAPGKPSANPQAAPPAPSTVATVAQHGGLANGKKRADGLIPGSKEALEADRKEDAERKKKARAANRPADPPPIPAAGTGPAQATPGSVGAVPGAPAPTAVPWTSDLLKPLFDQIVPTIETITITQISDRAAKANLPGAVINDITKSSAWSGPAKTAIQITAPQVAAKWMNKTGISAENAPEVILGTAVVAIVSNQMLVLKRLDELIRKQNPPVDPKQVPAPTPTTEPKNTP